MSDPIRDLLGRHRRASIATGLPWRMLLPLLVVGVIVAPVRWVLDR